MNDQLSMYAALFPSIYAQSPSTAPDSAADVPEQKAYRVPIACISSQQIVGRKDLKQWISSNISELAEDSPEDSRSFCWDLVTVQRDWIEHLLLGRPLIDANDSKMIQFRFIKEGYVSKLQLEKYVAQALSLPKGKAVL